MIRYSSFYLLVVVFLFLHYRPWGSECVVWEGISDEESKNVKHLTHEVELQIFSQHSKKAVALFCNTQEKKCRNVYSEFVKASNEVNDKEVEFLYIDTITLKKTADNFNVTTIPKILTFRDFNPEKAYTLSGKYTKENIKEWVELLPVASVEVIDIDSINKYLDLQQKKGYASIIAYATKNSDQISKFIHFGETHNIPNLTVGLTYIEKEEDTKIEIVNGPGSSIPMQDMKYKDTYAIDEPDNTEWTSEKITKFAAVYMKQFPIIIDYSRKRRKPQMDDIYFYIFDIGSYTDTLYAELYNVIQENPQMKFVFPKREERNELMNEPRMESVVCILDYRNATFDVSYQLLRPKKYVKFFPDEIKADQVAEFIKDFNDNKIDRYRRSEDVIRRFDQTQYQQLVSKNFESFVFDPQKIVLLFYHVKGCNECTKIFPFWKKVAYHFHLEYKDVLVATMDAKLNDMFDEHIDFYPALAIYPKGEDKLKRKKVLFFPTKLETLIDLVDEMLENEEEQEL